MLGQLLQPVPIESKPYVLEHFMGSRVIGMEGLPCLHVLDAETEKWAVIGQVPEIVDSSAELHLLVRLMGEQIVGIDDNEVIAKVHRTSIAVLAGWYANIDHDTLDEHPVPDLSRRPLGRITSLISIG